MALAVLLDAVGQAAQTPVFLLLDAGRAADFVGRRRGDARFGVDLGADGRGDGFDLLLGHVIACDNHAFV